MSVPRLPIDNLEEYRIGTMRTDAHTCDLINYLREMMNYIPSIDELGARLSDHYAKVEKVIGQGNQSKTIRKVVPTLKEILQDHLKEIPEGLEAVSRNIVSSSNSNSHGHFNEKRAAMYLRQLAGEIHELDF